MATADKEAAVRDLAHVSRSDRIGRLFGLELFGYQAAIADDPAPDVVTTCGRQVGKTETAGAIAADAFVCSNGYDVMVCAKWQETANETFRRAKAHLGTAGFGEGHPEIESWNKTELESVTGARLYSKTLKTAEGESGDNQRGKLPRVVIADESAIIEDSVFEQVIEPMFATHGADHEFYLFSTPRGRQGYHFEKHENDPEWSAHHIATPEGGVVDTEWVEGRKADVDELTWRQEYLGEFIDLGEVYIPRATYDGAATPHPDGPVEFLGVDIARQGTDRTVYLPMDGEGSVIEKAIAAEDVSDVPGIVDRIQSYASRHDTLQAVGIDENAVGGGVVDYAAMGLGGLIHPVKFTAKSKGQMYRKLKADLEQGAIAVPDADRSDSDHAVRLRDETVNLQFDYTANGNLKVGHAPGGRDDYADALAIVNWIRDKYADMSEREERSFASSF